jgi:hypothetical protein
MNPASALPGERAVCVTAVMSADGRFGRFSMLAPIFIAVFAGIGESPRRTQQ